MSGSLLSWVIVPFIKLEPPYTELKDLIRNIWDWWDENGKPRERIGEVIEIKGMRSFLEAIGVPPSAAAGQGAEERSFHVLHRRGYGGIQGERSRRKENRQIKFKINY